MLIPFETPEEHARGFCAYIARGLMHGYLLFWIPASHSYGL
jgi:hypothetical protein